jgi:hypothetical protein
MYYVAVAAKVWTSITSILFSHLLYPPLIIHNVNNAKIHHPLQRRTRQDRSITPPMTSLASPYIYCPNRPKIVNKVVARYTKEERTKGNKSRQGSLHIYHRLLTPAYIRLIQNSGLPYPPISSKENSGIISKEERIREDRGGRRPLVPDAFSW